MQDINKVIRDLYSYAKQKLGFDKQARIYLKKDKENANKLLGKTAYYDPQNMSIFVYTTNRHPKDILRSIAHELVHHLQNCRGDFSETLQTSEGYAQEDSHLREMEREAYESGSLLFRDFEDGLKAKRKDLYECLQRKTINREKNMINEQKEESENEVDPLKKSKANDHYVKRAERMFDKLTKKWKMDKKDKQEEDKKDV